MAADNIMAGDRRRSWGRLTAFQQGEARRLTLHVLSAAVLASPAGVAAALRQAGAVSPALEEHVLWAARSLTPQLRLSVDPAGQIDNQVLAGAAVRAGEARDEEGLFQ